MLKKLADVLEVSVDDLVYGADQEKAKAKIQDPELLAMFSKAQQLNDSDKEAIKAMLKAFLFQKDMQKQLAQ
ncbi:hypothetical protein [Roseivirga thermotolerans]|uniref:HTH cro/C1-type domain-containing protein n=1 Tax=Roseivirga thermotolerans TaxID=1758176 RepID=A0ABQ3IAP0_9BACT|nr:hypothetical protein [Roseivirga thermotolerans]GHE72286.1 hypothetical protein GCM10011340_30680 [Roseivirga thermotolerans]